MKKIILILLIISANNLLAQLLPFTSIQRTTPGSLFMSVGTGTNGIITATASIPLSNITGTASLLQTLSINTNSLSISSGNTIVLPTSTLTSGFFSATSPLSYNSTTGVFTITPLTITNTGSGNAAITGNTLNIPNTTYSYTPENVSNKATSFGTLNNTLYPSTQAVSNYITGFNYLTANQTITFTASGDVTGTANGNTSISPTFSLATVNSNTGTTGSATTTNSITVNGKGLVTGVGTIPIQIAESQVTNLITDLSNKVPFTGASSTVNINTQPLVAGRLSLGTANPITSSNIYIGSNITGATNFQSVFTENTVQSDVTGSAYGFISSIGTQATTFTLPVLYHYVAQKAAFGAGSTVTAQYGFLASNLTGATSNYGFYGGMAANTGVWNIYMAGNANNYLAGNLGIGVALPTVKLQALSTAEQLRLGYDGSNYASFIVGSNGLTTISATGTAPAFAMSNRLAVTTNSGVISLRDFVGAGAGTSAIYMGTVTPNTVNQTLAFDGSSTYLNGQASNSLYLAIGSTNVVRLAQNFQIYTPFAASFGAVTPFNFTQPNNSGQTASTVIPGFKHTGNIRGWNGGNITSMQPEVYFSAPTYSATAASTLSIVTGLLVDAPIAGTNVTFTNAYGIVTNGSIGLTTTGTGITIKEGANSTSGTATLVAGAVTVSNTNITATSRIFLTGNTITNAGILTKVNNVGTGFTITSTNGADVRAVDYFIIQGN